MAVKPKKKKQEIVPKNRKPALWKRAISVGWAFSLQALNDQRLSSLPIRPLETLAYCSSNTDKTGTEEQHCCWFRNGVTDDLSLYGGDSIV